MGVVGRDHLDIVLALPGVAAVGGAGERSCRDQNIAVVEPDQTAILTVFLDGLRLDLVEQPSLWSLEYHPPQRHSPSYREQ